MHKKKVFISDLKKDDLVFDVFVVKFKKPVEQYKLGYRFELRIADSSKEIMYKYWGSDDQKAVQRLYDSITKGCVILVKGRVHEWNNTLEISANKDDSIQVLRHGEYDVSDFVKKTLKDSEQMWGELWNIKSTLENPHLITILDTVFDAETIKKFKECPAAMYIHHGWIGGLLEHTLDVVKIADFYCTIHPKLDRDLVITGAILHDIGKLREFTVDTSISITDRGMLIGHVTIATSLITKIMEKLDTPVEWRMKLVHLILTHMGEYGSSKKPMMPEALALFYADQSNANLVHMMTLQEEANTEDDFIYHKDLGNIYLK